MTTYAVVELQEPAVGKVSGRRAVELPWAVLEDGRVTVAFESENRATAYMMKLRAWDRANIRRASM